MIKVWFRMFTNANNMLVKVSSRMFTSLNKMLVEVHEQSVVSHVHKCE